MAKPKESGKLYEIPTPVTLNGGSGGGSGMSELEKRVQRIEDTMATRDHIHELSLEIKDIKVELHKEISMLSRLLVSALFAVAGVMIAVMKLF